MGCSATNTFKESDIKNREDLAKRKKLNKNNGKEENKNHSNDKRKKKKEEKEEEKNIFLQVHILMKNLEVKVTDSKELKEKLKNIFDNLLENIKKFKAEVMIERVAKLFMDNLKPINGKNCEEVKNILNSLFEKDRNPNFFRDYLYEAIDNLNGKLGEIEETKIDDYIFKNLNKNKEIQKRQNELKQYRKKNYIIKYNDFIQIVKDFNINLDNLVFEYLLYKMKCGMSLNDKYSLDDLNFKIFLNYLDKSDEMDIKASNLLKESALDNKIENIGIEFKN